MLSLFVTVCVLATGAAVWADHDANPVKVDAAAMKPGPKLETLLSAELEGARNTEVIVSRVTIPPNTALPRHWHPGEEFAYVLEGRVTLWQKGKDDVVAQAGEVAKVPLRQVHTAITGEEGATVLVFRVHETGQPERVLVEE